MKPFKILKIALLCLILLSSCSKALKLSDLELKNNLLFKKNDSIPFTGKVQESYVAGGDSLIAKIDSGLYQGDYLVYYPTGAIKDSVLYKKGKIITYKRFQENGEIKKIPKNSLFQSTRGLTCFKNEKNDTVIFSGLAASKFAAAKKGEYYVNEENYLNGRLNGKSSGYYPNGKMEYVREFIEGNLTGKEISYYDNGDVQEEGKYNSGSRVGKWTRYYKGKKVDEVGKYVNGRKDSVWNEYYQNGKLEQTAHYVYGIKNGPYTAYYENGNVQARGTFQSDLRDGNWTFYRSDGSLDAEQKFSRGVVLRRCDCCGAYYNYDEGWCSRNPGFTKGAWDFFAGGGSGGGPYCSRGCANRCE